MDPRTEDQLFQDFRRTGDPAALAEVFDRTAPELLRIALHLSGDVTRAEDLVQTTFVTAIESAATFDPQRQLLPWLAGILTNRARELRRKESRGIDPGRIAVPGAEDPVRHAQDLELRSRLDETIRTLPEIYRPVLVLHLKHGLAAAEIAAALQRQVGTVRSQLVRGLELLRKLLPAGLALSALGSITAARGLAAIKTEVLAAAAAGPVAATAVGISLAGAGGVLVMKKAVLAVAVLLAGAIGWIVWQGAEGPESRALMTSGEPAAAEAPAPSAVAATTRPAEDTSRRIAAAAPAAAPRTSLLVRVRWGDDQSPAAGIALTARPWSASPIGLHDVAAVTSPEGTALLQDIPQGRVQVWLDRGGSGEVTVEPGARAELVLEVPPGVTVRGTVVRKDDAPVGGARIWISRQQADDEGQLAATSGDDGTFLLRSLQPGRCLSVFAAGHAPSALAEVQGRTGDTVTMRFVLQQPGRRVHGRVIDPSGAPVGGATVVLGRIFVNGKRGQFPAPPPPPTLLRTDERGEFATESVAVGAMPVHARAPGFAPWTGEVPLEADRGAIEIRLALGATVSGRVLDTAGKPCAGAWVEAGRFEVQAPHWLMDRTTTAEDGSFRLSGIASGEIPVGAGRPKERGVRERVIAADGQTIHWNPVLSQGLTIAGRVVDERRQPLVGWVVGARPSGIPGFSRSSGKTDAMGCFVVEDCDAGRHVLEIGDPLSRGILPALVRDGIAAGAGDILVVVPDEKQPSARIIGRVLGTDGSPAVGMKLSLWNELNRAGETFRTSAGNVGEAAAGCFATRRLPPGRYQVVVDWMPFNPLELGWRHLAPDETLDLGDIRLQTPGTYLVTARRPDGSPLTTSELWQIVRPDGAVRRIGPMRDGKLGSFPVQPGPYTVRIWSRETLIAERSFEVRSGETTKVELETSPGFVRTVVFHEEQLPANTVIRIAWEDLERGPIWKDEFTAGEAFGFTGSLERAFAKGRYRVRAETSLGTSGEGSFEVGGATEAAAAIRIPLR